MGNTMGEPMQGVRTARSGYASGEANQGRTYVNGAADSLAENRRPEMVVTPASVAGGDR